MKKQNVTWPFQSTPSVRGETVPGQPAIIDYASNPPRDDWDEPEKSENSGRSENGNRFEFGDRRPSRRVLLVEDQPIVSQGIAELINEEEDLEVCSIAPDAVGALQQVKSLLPDVVVLELALAGRGGLELIKEIKVRYPQQLILVLSGLDEATYALRALRAGACGYVMKKEPLEVFFTALRQVLKGGIHLSDHIQKRTLQRLFPGQPTRLQDPLEELSDRELEVFHMIGQGKPTREIARQLFLSPKTIESHRMSIKTKLNLKSATELVRYAIRADQAAQVATPA
jgi:DNA-binding NarL/FixJ family response regulator